MKKIILLLLLATLYSCTNNSQNTNNSKQTLNAKIEKDGNLIYVRNTSINSKFELTISIFIKDYDFKKSISRPLLQWFGTDTSTSFETQRIIELNPGERRVLGTSNYTIRENEKDWYGDNINYQVVGELEIIETDQVN